MNTDDLYSTLLVITSILQFQNTFLPVIIPIEKLNNWRDSFRKAREAHLIHKAKTIEPLGINKRDELVTIYSISLIFLLSCLFK